MAWSIVASEEDKPQGKWTRQPMDRKDMEALVDRMAAKYKVDPLAIKAIIQRESSWNPRAEGTPVGDQRAGGLMQLMPGTARDMGVQDVFDEEQNIEGGTRYFADALARAGGDYAKALKLYHGGRDESGWGPKTHAYAANVMQTYRDLGGRLYDPGVGTASNLDLAANAALPGVSFPEAFMRLVKGRGPDLSQGPSGPQGNLPVGQKLRNWWNSPSEAQPDIDRFRKKVQNRRDTDPWGSLGVELAASLPGAIATGNLANRGLEWLGENIPRASSFTNFLLGRAGYGLPGTAEGAAFLPKVASGAAQGAFQGAVSGVAGAPMSPETDLLHDAGFGAALGLGMGGLGTAVGQGVGRFFYGPRIHPAAARLGQEVMAGEGVPQMRLHAAPGNTNRLALETPEFTRVGAGTFGEAAMPNTPDAWQAVERRIGAQLDRGAANAHIPLDREFHIALQDTLDALPEGALRNASLRRLRDRLFSDIRAGVRATIPGEEYLDMTARGGRRAASDLARAEASADLEVRRGAALMRNFLNDQLERGAQERVAFAVQQGDEAGALAARQALDDIRQGKEAWKHLKTFQDVADPVTGEVQPEKLARAVEQHFRTPLVRAVGEVPTMARAGLAFDDQNLARKGSRLLPLSGVAAGAGAIMNAPVTTGQAALGLAASALTGKLGLDALRNSRAYTNALLRRSASQRPGAFQTGLGRVSIPLATNGGNMLFASPPE